MTVDVTDNSKFGCATAPDASKIMRLITPVNLSKVDFSVVFNGQGIPVLWPVFGFLHRDEFLPTQVVVPVFHR